MSDNPINETHHDLNVSEISKSMQRFGVLDYCIFMAMLIGCSGIGLYFGFHQNRDKKKMKHRRGSVELDYLVGGRNMKTFPVAMSLIASWISGISLLGISTEIYVYGTEFMLVFGAILICGLAVNFIFLPVFVELQLTSTYEYLEQRFDKRLRLLGAILFTVGTTCWIPIVIYVPALAFNQVTGINIHVITPIVCIICIFYTTVGGIKAVVWTDVVQTVIMFITMMLIVIKGTIDVGGLSVVWERNYEGGRIEFPEFTLDPTVRHSVLSILVGGSLFWIQANSVNQGMFQRYLSLPNLKSARRALWIFIVGVSFLMFLCCYNGLLVYATYHDCDPLTTKLAKAKDQLIPVLVMDVFKDYPGLPGVFVAGIFSAALSSLSTGLNSLSAIFLEDFVKPSVKKPLTEKQTSFVMRSVVIMFGIICVALVFVVQHLGSVLQLSISLSGITNGPLFAIFLMGLMMPFINKKSALVGGVVGLAVMTWVTFHTQKAIAMGHIKFEEKPVTTEGCTYEFAQHVISNSTIETIMEEVNPIYRMSYFYITLFGTTVTMIVSFMSIPFCGLQDPLEINPDVVAPFVRRFVKKPPTESELLTKKCVTYEIDNQKVESN